MTPSNNNPNRPATISEIEQLFKDLMERQKVDWWLMFLFLTCISISLTVQISKIEDKIKTQSGNKIPQTSQVSK